MSTNIGAIPNWKLALIERKRRQDKDSSVECPPSSSDCDRNVDCHDSLPPWKRDILSRKHNQRNTYIFLAKQGANEDIDKKVDESRSGCELNGRVQMSLYNGDVESYCVDTSDKYMDTSTNDQPIEERLLPIHQNPIFRHDLQKRRYTSSSSSRKSLSPRLTPTYSSGEHEISLTNDTANRHVVAHDGEDGEDVFNDNNEDNESEVTYGKGFVHKLLMKFSHLSSSDQHFACHSLPRSRSSGSGSWHSQTTSHFPVSLDTESIPSKPHTSMPTAKFHSFDNLLHEIKMESPVDHTDQRLDQEHVDGTVDILVNLENGITNEVVDTIDQRDSELCDERPLTNIVSNARSLFESLAVHSVVPKSPTSPGTSAAPSSSNRLSYVGTLERSPVLKTSQSPTQSSSDVVNGSDKTVTVAKQSVEPCTQSAVVLGSPIPDTCASVPSESRSTMPTKTGICPESHVLESRVDKAIDCQSSITNGTTVQTESTAEVQVSAQKKVSAVAVTGVDKRQSTNAPVADKPCQVVSADENTGTGRTDASNTTSTTSAGTTKDRIAHQQQNVSNKKSAPSRPGKLLIRPASNLVASKTNSEYLKLTSYNDVRTGQFAPAVRKDKVTSRDDDDVDQPDSNPSAYEVCEFEGAGVVVGQSLLIKTNKRKSMQIHFAESMTQTFEYPSEQSLMAASPPQPGYVDYEGEDLMLGTGLLVAPNIVSAGALGSYQSRTQVDYYFGMHMEEDRKPTAAPPAAKLPPPRNPSQASPASESTSWSKEATPDILF